MIVYRSARRQVRIEHIASRSGKNRHDLSAAPRLANRASVTIDASSAYAAPSAGAREGSALAGSYDLGVGAFREVLEVSRKRSEEYVLHVGALYRVFWGLSNLHLALQSPILPKSYELRVMSYELNISALNS
jgi:hypothetical protein